MLKGVYVLMNTTLTGVCVKGCVRVNEHCTCKITRYKMRLNESQNVWLIDLMASHRQLKVRNIDSSSEAGDNKKPSLLPASG